MQLEDVIALPIVSTITSHIELVLKFPNDVQELDEIMFTNSLIYFVDSQQLNYN